MAENSEDKILLNVGLNTEEAEAGITALGQKIQGVAKQDLGTSNVQSYKLQIRELTAELQRIEQVQGRNSQAFRDGAKELGRLKLAAADFKQTIEAANPALGKFGALVPIAKGASVALMGAAGAMGLFGIRGEKAEEVMLRLQSILALSHALSGIHELGNGYRAFVSMLGLTTTAAVKQVAATDSQTVSTVALTDALTVQATAQENLAAAQTAFNEASIASETANNAVKAEGLDATVGMTAAEQLYLDTLAVKQKALAELTAAQAAYDESLVAGTEASVSSSEASTVQVASIEAVTVAQEGATGAAIGLKVALWAIGIGLITTAIAYLISNWDKVKTSIENLFPALKTAGNTFKDIQNDLLGVGNAVLHWVKSPVDALITSVKILIDVMKGDFKAVAKDFQDGLKQQMSDLDVLSNFKSGKADAEAKDAIAANKIRVQSEIDANERIIKERKALGQDTYTLEIKNQQLKNSLIDADTEKGKKDLLDGQSEITVLQNTEIKKRADAADKLKKAAQQKADALKKEELNKLKSGEDEAQKVLLEGRRSQRDIELADADFKYQKLIAIAKKYGKDSSDLEQALGITKLRINQKYTEEVKEYLAKADDETLSEFEKKRKQILKDAETALKNATPEQAEQINASRDYQIDRSFKEESLSNATDAANNNLTNTETANRAGANGKDSAQATYDKEEAIRKAKLVALKAQYDQEQFLAYGNAQKLAEINAKYNKDTKESDDDAVKAKIELAEKEKDAKVQTYQTVADALNVASDIAGKSTAAGKALAVASATISTYLSAQKAFESVVGIPVVGPALAAVAAATAVASGLLSVKQILAVKVPGASSSAGSVPSYSPPTINSTVLNQAQQGIQNVNVVNKDSTQDSNKPQSIRAFLVTKDLTDAQDREEYLNRRSTI